MQTFIISSKNLEKGREEVDRIIRLHKVNKFDIETVEPEGALGIEDVRNIQKKVFLKPFKGEKKAIILILANGATIEAQNAMLKLLEEPPPSSFIFLVSANSNSFLPTILSRTKLIELTSDKKGVKGNLSEILRMQTIGDRLYLAQNLSKEKEEAINFLEGTILEARDEMLKSLGDKQEALRLRKLIHKLELTHYDLKNTNANARLALENLFLSI